MNEKSRHISQLLVFVLVISGLSILYNYPETLLKRPQSVHNWRQCDGASLALNYYQEGMHFFKPQTHMLYSDNFTTGYTMPSEIPLLYYSVAILYKIFGYHEYLFRGLNLLLFFMGLFYLFKLANLILRNLFTSTLVLVLIFSSPILVYYANNFLPNTVALSLSFAGWYYFYRYSQNKRTRTFLVSVIFFGLAATMKITELTGPLIILMLLVADRLNLLRLQLNSGSRFWFKIVSLLAIFGFIAGWVFYAKYYNNLHGSTQFSTYTFPIWAMNHEEINFTLHKMNVLWFKDYLYPPTFCLMLACLIAMIFLYKRADKILLIISLFLVAALIAYSLLWFQALGDHDYFYIGFYILPAFIFISFFVLLGSFHLKKFYYYPLVISGILFAGANIAHAQKRYAMRYQVAWINDFNEKKDLYTIKPWLDTAGITNKDTIIFYPSVYIRPLYLMNLKGWVIYPHSTVDAKTEERDSLEMNVFISKGAKFFVTNEIKSAMNNRPFQPYLKDLYGKYNSIYVFRLPPRRINFNPADTINMN